MSPMLQEAESSPSRKSETYIYAFMHPEEYESDSHSSLSGEEELHDSEDEDGCH